MDTIDLLDGWKLALITPGETSPMLGHRGGEIAVDEPNKLFYGWAVFAATYGLDCYKTACIKYMYRNVTSGAG